MQETTLRENCGINNHKYLTKVEGITIAPHDKYLPLGYFKTVIVCSSCGRVLIDRIEKVSPGKDIEILKDSLG